MARKKNTQKAEAPVKEKKAIFKKKAVEAPKVEEEVVDLDKKLAESEAITGTGVQAYLRDKIKHATKRG